MRANTKTKAIFQQFAVCVLLSSGIEVAAIPAPQNIPNTGASTPVPLTEFATGTDGNVITAVFTPTTLAISGLSPPINTATTITQVITSNDAAETVAVVVAVGAGIVGAGALAAWLFKPVPNAPPVPTTPPSYPTSSQPDPPKTDTERPDPETDTLGPTTTSEQASACPFVPITPTSVLTRFQQDPAWTGPTPTLTVSTVSPVCTPQGSNSQLFRGADPGYLNALAAVFCKGDLSKDRISTLGTTDLPDESTWKMDGLEDIKIRFQFKFGLKDNKCPQNCVDTYTSVAKTCQYNSHVIYGGASSAQGCGVYSFTVDAKPQTKKACHPVDSRGVQYNYMYRDAAISQIASFCSSIDGKSVKQGDTSTNMVSGPFSVSYSNECTGSGTYKITKDICNEYLGLTVDDCDTDTTMFKHGGTLTDTDNCGEFTFSPKSYDESVCYPGNKDRGYITDGEHVAITHAMAVDAINQFCGRSGNGQQYTLDPSNMPESNSFVHDTCTTAGYASCDYYYRNDGSRVTSNGDMGDISIRAVASFWEPSGFTCQPKLKYEIHGDRCVQELKKVLDGCNTNSLDNKDLGSFLESGENGCVRWDMWAVTTHD